MRSACGSSRWNCFWAKVSFRKGIAMPAAVKIKAGRYGNAIGLLLERGGAFQTRHQRTLIVNSDQRKALEEADLVETNGLKDGSGKAVSSILGSCAGRKLVHFFPWLRQRKRQQC